MVLAIYLSFLAAPSICFSGDFSVTPIKLDLGSQDRTGAITVQNNGTEPLNLQVRAFEWTEYAQGKDVYTETKDLIFYPVLMTVDPKGQRLIRVGIRMPAISAEKAYRLFIEEIPGPKKPDQVAIRVAIRFGVPIFVKPLKEQKPSGEIVKAGLSKGNLSFVAANTGNEHFSILSITTTGSDAQGKTAFTKEISGWYLLAGASREYSVPVPEAVCNQLSDLEINIKTDDFSIAKKVEVKKEMCAP